MSSVYTTQVLTISVIFGFAFAMGSAIRNQIWERESKNAQVNMFIFEYSLIFVIYSIVIYCKYFHEITFTDDGNNGNEPICQLDSLDFDDIISTQYYFWIFYVNSEISWSFEIF